MNFSDLGLSPETLKAVEDVGYSTPTPIQEQAIPYVLMGRDVLGIAQTGTGKTASFTLPMIDILAQGRAKARMPRSLILAPTRELANQVAENFTLYGKYHKLSMALLIGGESFSEQEKALERGVDVLIATPGRLMDLFGRGRILLRDVKVLVIDEADRMLDMGFIPDVERIVSLLPPLRQTLFFSATMDEPIQKLAEAFLSNPREVRVAPKQSTAATVAQHLVVVDELDKRESLRHILRLEDVRNAFIFCNRKRDVAVLYRSLTKHGFDVAQLHGDMPQQERTATLASFKAGNVRLLVCSDVAARGIDIADVSHVFNFDVPTHSEDYVHRIGRTGRAGREGRAFTIATPQDTKYVGLIEALIGQEITRLDLEGIASQELSEEAAKQARSGKRPHDKRRDRDDRRDRKRDDRSQAAPVAAAPVAAGSAPALDVVSPSPVTSPESTPAMAVEGRSEQRTDSRQDSRSRRDRDRGGRSRRNHPAWEVDEMDHGDDVIAFGGYTPAFLLVDPGDFSNTEEDLLSDEDADQLIDEVVEVIEDTSEPDEDDLPRESVTMVDAEESRGRSRRRRSGRGGRGRQDTERAAASATVEAEEPTAAIASDNAAEQQNEGDAAAAEGVQAQPARSARRTRTRKRAAAPTTLDAVAEAVSAVVDAAEVQPLAEVIEQPEAEAAPAPAPAPKKAPRRRAPSKKVVAPVVAEAEAVVPVAAVEASPVQEEALVAAKPKRTRAAKAAVATPETAEQPKPKRTRAKKATPAEAATQASAAPPEGEAEAEAAPAAKIRKPRVSKKAAVTAETEDAPQAPVKPKRTRKAAPKKAAASEGEDQSTED